MAAVPPLLESCFPMKRRLFLKQGG